MIQFESMSGHRHRGHHLDTKPAREIFLTSSSLSFSSLSSSTASWDDAVERNTKESRTSWEDTKGKLSDASSKSSEKPCATHVGTQPGPSPLSRLRPVQLRNKGLGCYDPERIPASVFGKTADLNWSEVSNESLFSLKTDGFRMSNGQAFRQSNLKPEEVLRSGDFLAYSPYLSIKLEEPEEKISEVEEVKSEETGVTSSVETRIHQEKSSSSTPIILWSANPSNSYSLGEATKAQSLSLPIEEKKSKKRKKTNKSKKKKKKKMKNKCCMWSWLCSRFSKCEVNLCCYKWRKCCKGPKATRSSPLDASS